LTVLQDPTEPNLIFVGTEQGMYISLDNGVQFKQWKKGYQSVSNYDFEIQDDNEDLRDDDMDNLDDEDLFIDANSEYMSDADEDDTDDFEDSCSDEDDNYEDAFTTTVRPNTRIRSSNNNSDTTSATAQDISTKSSSQFNASTSKYNTRAENDSETPKRKRRA
jgi:hypothetical protein